ncbi:phytoene/squalene synthase family protein [Microvirga pudoricolor]|uniref:phytoene/squalene synthase family protein n=1 Tax=Microvirga pudoricolor TaxID=2778729 RepID=UPI00194F56BF|nr:phytoene/squalene synthase family protein [Microvirga pudoricolor]MBM6596134.1 squalene/phytoene synthase family protein [Microvirga pudoricolor]
MTEASQDAGPDFAFSHCEAIVREGDPDRFWASLFAPVDKRPHLHALHAFNFEIGRVRESVHEPLVGEIRLQWWRDALQGEVRGDVRSNPVAAALEDTIVRFRLPRQPFVDLIDARIFDLYSDPMPNLNDLEGYCGETASVLIRLASVILMDGNEPGGADASGHAGVAYAVTGLLRAFPWHARRGQVYLPADILSRHGVVRDDIVTGRGGPGLQGALADLRSLARHHLAQARMLSAAMAAPARPALRGLSLVEPYLSMMERADYDPFMTPIDLPQWRRIWHLWRGRV